MYIFNANTNILTWKTVKHSVGFRIYIIIMTNNMTTVNMTTVNMANLADQTCTMTRTKLMVEKSFIWNNETEKQIRFLWLWVVTHENQIYWAFAVFNWVFVKSILGNTAVSLYFLNNINYSIWVSITYYALFVWKTIWYSRKIIGWIH